jgi:hypothetical protein
MTSTPTTDTRYDSPTGELGHLTIRHTGRRRPLVVTCILPMGRLSPSRSTPRTPDVREVTGPRCRHAGMLVGVGRGGRAAAGDARRLGGTDLRAEREC